MPSSPNKGYTQPAYNSEVGTWGTDINNNFSGIVDNNLGGTTSVSLSNANVTLSASQAQNLVIKLTGTLLASVAIYSPIIGFCIVENNTSGSYTVTWQANFGAGNIGSSITVGQGARMFLVSDTSAGARLADTASVPSGTKTIYYQAAAPTGWTQVTTLNDYLLRVVNGTGGVPHAGAGFSSVNASVTTADHTLTIAEMPSHKHTDSGHTHTTGYSAATAGGSNFYSLNSSAGANVTGIGYANLSNTGGGGGHSHGLALGISYVDMILCSRN